MKLTQKLALAWLRLQLKLTGWISPRAAANRAFRIFTTPQFRVQRPLPAVFTKADEIRFDFRGAKVIGYSWQPEGIRKVLVIHGFESSAVNFESYIQPLIDKDYQVFAFDAPAHGRSSGRRFNALEYRDFLKEIIAKFGPFGTYISHSVGGLAICMALAELPHPADTRLVLIAPATDTRSTIDRFFRIIAVNNPSVRRKFEEIITHLSGFGIDWFSVGRTLPLINAKILWIHDHDDDVTPVKDALRIERDNQNAIDFVFTKGLGHRRIYRDQKVGRTIVNYA